MPKISVVMPIYNSEKYIRESIDSVLNQTYSDFELLAIYDNGTIDSTPKILEEYVKKDNRVKTINIGEERGLVKALNHGIKVAQGEYIARMDDDDICIINRFEEQVKFLDEKSDVHIVGSWIEAIGDKGDSLKENCMSWFNQNFNHINNIEEKFLDGPVVAHPSVMMRKSIFDKLDGYSEEFKEAEDYDLWLRALKNEFKIWSLDKVLLKYRMYDKSKTNRSNDILNYVITAKLNYLHDKIDFSKKSFDCIVWGASNGGKVVKEYISEKFKSIRVIAFVDKYKNGDIDQIKIYNTSELDKLKYQYVFIATQPGRDEAKKILCEMGYKNIKDFLYVI